MGWVLVLIGLPSFLVGLVSLVRPIRWLRISDRKVAALIIAASPFVMTAGVVTRPAATAAEPTVTTTTEAETEPTDELPPDVLLILAIRGASSQYGGIGWVDLAEDEVLIELGHDWCERFGDGNNFETVGLAAISTVEERAGNALRDADIGMIGYAMAAAVDTYCPEHLAPIDGHVGVITEFGAERG